MKENHFCDLIALQCWVNAGSIHEKPTQRGLAHFIEHMLFKGTAKRVVGEIAKTVEACGGDINAYTTFERTVYYLTLRSEHLETGLDILSDAIFHSSFQADEIEREREVIIEEIRRSLDSPSVLIGRKLFAQCFKGTEAERPIIGFAEQIETYKRDDLLGFYKRWYVPENMAFVGVGALNGRETQKMVKNYFGQQKPATKVSGTASSKIERDFPGGIRVELIKGDYQQPRLEFAFACPSFEHEDSALLDIAAFALGSGEMSRLNQVLCNEKALVTGATASVFAPGFGGIFSVSSAPILNHFEATITATVELLLDFKYRNTLTAEELARAKANIKADRLYQDEGIESQAKAIGFGLTTKYKFAFDDIYISRIEASDLENVADAVQRWLSEKNVVIVAMVPKESSLTEEKILSAFEAGLKQGEPAKTTNTTKKSPGARLSAHKPKIIKIHDRITLAHRQNPTSPFINLSLVTSGGLRFEPRPKAGLFYSLSSLLAKATQRLNYDRLQLEIEGMAASINGFSGKDSFGLKVHCLKEHSTEIFDLFMDTFLNPVFPDQQWQILLREIEEHIQTENDSPSQIAIRKFQELLLSGHPYCYPAYGFKDSVANFDQKLLLDQYLQFRDQGNFILGCVSPFSDDFLAMRMEKLFSYWAPNDRQRKLDGTSHPSAPAQPQKAHVQKDREQTHIIMGFKGLSWQDKARSHLELLSTILGGQGGRLFLKLRDQDSLAYTVAPIFYFGVDPGIFATYIACAPDKKERASAALLRELELVCKEPVAKPELERAKNYLLGAYEADLQHGDAQAMNMALMELYGLGADDFLNYPQTLQKVTAEELRKSAQKIFDFKNIVEVSVGS